MEFWWDSRPFANSDWLIVWAADKYAQPITALQPHYSQINKPKSRHTVVCRAAQEAGA